MIDMVGKMIVNIFLGTLLLIGLSQAQQIEDEQVNILMKLCHADETSVKGALPKTELMDSDHHFQQLLQRNLNEINIEMFRSKLPNYVYQQDKLNEFTECFYNVSYNDTQSSDSKRYCSRKGELLQCINNYTDELRECKEDMSETTCAGVNLLMNYVCYEESIEERKYEYVYAEDRECFKTSLLTCILNEHSENEMTDAYKLMMVNDSRGNPDQLASCIINALAKCAPRPDLPWPSECCR